MNILRAIKRFICNLNRRRKMNNMRKRRESVVSVYKRTTKFLSNTPNLLKIMPNRKYWLLKKMLEEYEGSIEEKTEKKYCTSEEEEENFGERDLDYYLGVRKKERYWRDPAGKEQIRKDFLVYHCGVSEEDYENDYKISAPNVSYVIQPKLKQVPFKIHRKIKTQKGSLKDDSWREKRLFRLFAYKRESEYSTSDSYSECDSSGDRKDSDSEEYSSGSHGDHNSNEYDEEGVRIKEVSEGRPCDNCPELCPGFIPHAWRKTCKSCGCDRLKHSVYHEELSSVRERLGLRESHALDTLPGLSAAETELFWQSLSERLPAGKGGAGPADWREWRVRALASQLPKQDLSLAHCKHVDEVHKKQYEDFVAARNEIALDIGIGRQVFGKSLECMGCSKPIRSGNIAVDAPRLGEQAHFHPGCFSCSECDEPLVELAYCALDGRLYCVRHYAERLKPRCESCDESRRCTPHPCSLRPPRTDRPVLPFVPRVNHAGAMGLALSVVISYAGLQEAIACVHHLASGVLPDHHPGFDDLVEFYTRELQKASKQTNDWTTACGQGYLCLKEDADGKLSAGAVKYYRATPDSTAILFCTKISSFGDSVEEPPVANGDYRTPTPERYSPSKTRALVLNTNTEAISVPNRNKSPGADPQTTANSFDRREPDRTDEDDKDDKLTWQYTPLSSTPEIHFQSYDDDKPGFINEDYLRSLDGIKYRPLQRSDPSGRRRSFRKRRSSSSTSSRESRTSRDEELQMFTSLEEAEFPATAPEAAAYGSAPNLWPNSFRSRSRERRADTWSVDSGAEDKPAPPAPEPANELPKDNEVIEEEDVDDFWGNSGD